MGDFNINYQTDNASQKEFKTIMTLHGFKQLVKLATRITMETKSLIDLVFVNRPGSFPMVYVVATSLSQPVYNSTDVNSAVTYLSTKLKDLFGVHAPVTKEIIFCGEQENTKTKTTGESTKSNETNVQSK